MLLRPHLFLLWFLSFFFSLSTSNLAWRITSVISASMETEGEEPRASAGVDGWEAGCGERAERRDKLRLRDSFMASLSSSLDLRTRAIRVIVLYCSVRNSHPNVSRAEYRVTSALRFLECSSGLDCRSPRSFPLFKWWQIYSAIMITKVLILVCSFFNTMPAFLAIFYDKNYI